MDPETNQSNETKKLLEELLAVTDENNKMLRYIKRDIRIGRMMRILYWVLIIGSFVGAFYFIQPFINQLIGVYGGGDILQNLQNLKQ